MQLSELISYLRDISQHHSVEIIYLVDDKEISTGEKKERLINMAKGEYVVIIDDDDTVSLDYFNTIMPVLINEKPDCIGYLVDLIGMGAMKTACISIHYPEWARNINGHDLVRYTHEKVPIKRKHAISAGWSWMRYDDDYCFSMNLKRDGNLKKEVFINKKLYIYHSQPTDDPDTKYGFNKIYKL